MKIAFIDDLCSCCSEGGAQKNNWNMIRKGIERGHKIVMITPQNKGIRSLNGVDLVIFCNIKSFSKEEIKAVAEKFPIIFRHHDYNFFKYRLHYPMIKGDYRGIDKDFWSEIYMKAKMHIWLSPLHREAYLVAFPELAKYKSICIPSALDVDMWKPVEGIERKKGTVIGVNSLELFKGRYNVNDYVEKHPELQFTFVGSGAPLRTNNCKYLPYIPNEELPKFYSEHESFIHLPSTTEPFGRVSTEALLTGCKIITNENNGAFSYDWMRKDTTEQIRQRLSEASLAFWEVIEEEFGLLKYKKQGGWASL